MHFQKIYYFNAGENFGDDGTAENFWMVGYKFNLGNYRGNNYKGTNYEDKNYELTTFQQPLPTVKLVWNGSTNQYKKARGRGWPLEYQEKKTKRKLQKLEMERVYKSYSEIKKIVAKFIQDKENVPPPALKKKKKNKKSENN